MRKFRVMAALCAVFLLVLSLSTVAYAGGGEEIPEETPAPEPVAAPNPFTPAGTGTVIDNATDADGKEFYTIMTPSENVFYLIIDRQRETENVYFLNAVTEKDLLALAEQSGDTDTSAIPETPIVTPTPEPEPTPEPAPEPESGGGMGMMIFVVAVVLIGGGAGYYFKIYRPKQQQADIEEDYDYDADEADPYGEDEQDAEDEDDSPPWYEDEDESAGSGGDGEA